MFMNPQFNRPVAYIRIPKTGSTSIIASLHNIGIPSRMYYTKGLDHMWVIEYKQINDIAPEQMREHYVFTTVRNPLDRFLSGWRFCLRQQWIPHDMSPMDLLQAIHKEGKQAFNYNVFLHVIKPQSRWIFKNGNMICNNIIRFEQFSEDIKHIIGYLGVKDLKIEHKKNNRDDCDKHPGTNDYYLIKHPHLRSLHHKVFEEDWRRLSYNH